jgi:hypothetical protein
MWGRWHGTCGRIRFFFYRKSNENLELGTGFLYIRESCLQLRELSLLVIGCHS